MSDTKKNPGSAHGSFVVVGILLVCGAAAYLSVVRYQGQVSASEGAQLLYEGQVMATFAPSTNNRVNEGQPAIVTIRGYSDQKFVGHVKLVHKEDNGETTTMIQLADAPADAKPPLPCKVTVDTTALVVR